MSILHVGHIKANLEKRFSTLIDVGDVNTRSESEKHNHFLTRALAAFSLAALARIDDKVAADCVVDESLDDGIDAFYFDRTELVGYIVQAKWIQGGDKTIDLGSALKFKQGVNHFFEGGLSNLGPKLRAKQVDIEDALGDSRARFVLVVAYPGKQQLSNEAQKPFDALLEDLNDDDQIVRLQVLGQKELHEVVEQLAFGDTVDLEVMLQEYGKVSDPFRAYYGQVHVKDLLEWARYGDRIYARNLRGFKGSTEVNQEILETLRSAPENFIYFNNGITITCASIAKQPLGLGNKLSGVFECKGASIVNGAQTVGSIISALADPTLFSDTAKVIVRLISLEGCPRDFCSDITRAVNTQNRIEKRDFAALDSQQARLKSELFLSYNKQYVFKAGEALPANPESGCTLDEATVALACASLDINLCLQAKREVGKLYDNIETVPYIAIFNPSTSALRLWRAVQVLRSVDSTLKEIQSRTEGKARLVAIHFNRLVLHLVFFRMGTALEGSENEFSLILATTPYVTTVVLFHLNAVVVDLYPLAYPGSLFKNATKSKEIAAAVRAIPLDKDLG